MTTLYWLHDKALHSAHDDVHDNTRTVFIWDNNYFTKKRYSLKRLVFIYECLCELPVDILFGDTVSLIRELHPEKVIIQDTPDSDVCQLIATISQHAHVEIIPQENFSQLPEKSSFKRFFPFWHKAKKYILSD